MEIAKPKKEKVKLISYEIKMVIPTGSYANIQPCIVVKAGTVEEAHDYIAPHMNKLWKEYYMISDRKPSVPVAEELKKEQEKANTAVTPQAPVAAVAFTKASQAIASCLGEDALNLIDTQIKKSVKLTDEDKENLNLLVIGKRDQLLNGKVNPA